MKWRSANHCDYTHQFESLEVLHQKYDVRSLVVVGFASNDFNQGTKTEEDAAKVRRENFGVSLAIIAPSYVRGYRANPIFKELNRQSQASGWNFTEYLLKY